MIFLVDWIKALGKASKWDQASVDGTKVGRLAEDVKVGFKDDHGWIKFTFDNAGTPMVAEGRFSTKGKESVFVDGVELPDGRIAVRPIVTARGLPPKAAFKLAVILVAGSGATKQEFRFDVKVASS